VYGYDHSLCLVESHAPELGPLGCRAAVHWKSECLGGRAISANATFAELIMQPLQLLVDIVAHGEKENLASAHRVPRARGR